MNSSVLQNPSDPDATFREKAGKKYRGYVANVDEAVGGNGSVVLDYQFEQNNPELFMIIHSTTTKAV